MNLLKSGLIQRQNAVSTPIHFDTPDVTNDLFDPNKKAIEELIIEQAQYTKELTEKQNAAKNLLRQSDIAEFYKDIKYTDCLERIKQLTEDAEKAQAVTNSAEQLVSEAEQKIKDLRAQLVDESAGAERVNNFLYKYSGSENLKLEPSQPVFGDNVTTFDLKRNGQPAYNLSEGEQSLISFCYFVARLGAEDNSMHPTVVYVDDPISSVDDEHMFFIYGLLESQIATNVGEASQYQQLFVSTHNLSFLKYLQRLSSPNGDKAYFLISNNSGVSTITGMPKRLKHYSTQMHYLFERIYKASKGEFETYSAHDIGNELRRFLEAYLFYRYPFSSGQNNQHFSKRLDMFFGDDRVARERCNRLINERSHAGGDFDAAWLPWTNEEITAISTDVISKMEELDEPQFKGFLDAIGITGDN